MNGADGRLVVRFFSMRPHGERRAGPQAPDELRLELGRPLGLGVLGRVLIVDDEPEQLRRPPGVGLVPGLELLPRQLDQLGDERVVAPRATCRARPWSARRCRCWSGNRPTRPSDACSPRPWLGGEDAADLPVFLGDERLDRPLALDHQPHGHALHPAGAQPLGDLPPQQRRDLVADDPVEDAPRLLGVDAVDVDRVRRSGRPSGFRSW